jgi:uncharacterized protein
MVVQTLPMFPLSTVLFPGAVVPLRLFEPRYLKLFEDLLSGDKRFGIVLIERGTESGGGDVRFETACVAVLVGAAPQDDGTLMTINVGAERIKVVEWLEDDPYPRAVVTTLADGEADEEVVDLTEECRQLFTRVFALASELGADMGELPELSFDPVRAVFEMAHLAPLQALDQQRILEADDPQVRTRILRTVLGDLAETFRLELALGTR